MSMRPLSRRQFAQLTGAAALPLAAQSRPLTAQEAVGRIEAGAGLTAGDPNMQVRGIATTAMATLVVLGRAVQEHCNLVVTLEPVYFGRADAPLANDPIFTGKKEFIEKNGLAVWRLPEKWRTREPDPFAVGLARSLGWKPGPDPLRYEVRSTLGGLAALLKKQLKARAGIRVVGDPKTAVRRVALLPGVSALAASMKILPDADVIIAGETREWESVEYAADTVASGQKKGLIMLGRVLSEDPGMNVCAQHIRTLVSEVPVRWIPAGDPFWRPA